MDTSQPAQNASVARGPWDNSNNPEEDPFHHPSPAGSAAFDDEAAQAVKTSLRNPLQENLSVGGRAPADDQRLAVPDSEDEDEDALSSDVATLPSSSPQQCLPLSNENENNANASYAAHHESSGPLISQDQEVANDRPSVTNEPTISPSDNHPAKDTAQREKKRKFEQDSTATSVDETQRPNETQDTIMTDLSADPSKIADPSSNPSPSAGGAEMKSMENQAEQHHSQSEFNPQSQSPSHVQTDKDRQGVTVQEQVDAGNSSTLIDEDHPKSPIAEIVSQSDNIEPRTCTSAIAGKQNAPVSQSAASEADHTPTIAITSKEDAPVSQSAETEHTTPTTDTDTASKQDAPNSQAVEAEITPPTTDPTRKQDTSISVDAKPTPSTETASKQDEPISDPAASDPKLTPDEQKTLLAAQTRTSSLSATEAELSQRQSSLVESFSATPSIKATLPANPPDAEAVIAAAKAVIKEHIRLLHDYNEIRDVGQGLMGIIAESRGVRIKDVQEEFDIGAKD